MCKPIEAGKAYFRPIICSGSLTEADIFSVGNNPATIIKPSNMDLNTYVNLLLNYKMYIGYYKSFRKKMGNTEISRTRVGMNSFFETIRTVYDGGIIETDIVCYPTKTLRELKKEPQNVKEKGNEIFYKLLMEFKPKLIILHGKDTLDQTIELLKAKQLISIESGNINFKIRELEKKNPLLEFTYPSGEKAVIMVCRNFLFYGLKVIVLVNSEARLLR